MGYEPIEITPMTPRIGAEVRGIDLTKSLGKELADTNIRVNCITPAVIETEILKQCTQAHIDYMVSKIPMGRVGKAGEVAALIAYVGMGAPVLLYFFSNQIFAYMIARGDVEGDALGAVRVALIAKAGLVEVGAMIGGVAWLMLCLQTNVAHIPQIYFGVFLGPLAMLLNAMHYFPTPERIRWWLLSREV